MAHIIDRSDEKENTTKKLNRYVMDDPKVKWFGYPNKIIMWDWAGLIVNNLKDLVLAPKNKLIDGFFDELDDQINTWAIYNRECGNLCDFCYTIDKTVRISIGYIGDRSEHSVIKICKYCKDNFVEQLEKLFSFGKTELIIPYEDIKFTKEMLLNIKEVYSDNNDNYDDHNDYAERFSGDCIDVERFHLIPTGLNFNATKNIFETQSIDRPDWWENISDDMVEPIKLKEWVIITNGFDDGWYHGHGDRALAFNCSKERFGQLCIIYCTDTGFYYKSKGHYLDYMKCMINHVLIDN